jgi:hypothetical protein
MKRAILVWTIAFPFVFVVSTAAAQHGHGGSPKPSSHGSSAPKTTSHTTMKRSHTTTKTTHGGSSHASKPAKTSSPKPVKTSSTKTTKAPKAPKTTKTAKAKNTTTTTTATTTSTTTLTPVQQKLQKNPKLASKLQSRLPAGTDLMTAAKGFKNFGQFNAAVNVSHNLGISFTELKTRMVDGHMSLGQAIQDVRPNTDAATIQRASGGQL